MESESKFSKYHIIFGFLVVLISNVHFIRKLSYLRGLKETRIFEVSSPWPYQLLDHDNSKNGFYQNTPLSKQIEVKHNFETFKPFFQLISLCDNFQCGFYCVKKLP